jgi:hypothetical protein
VSETKEKLKLVFAPGCFDHFDGTQEELDELMAEIQASFESGELLEQGVPISELDDDEIQEIIDLLDVDNNTKTLQ